METKIIRVFYNVDNLPYKDSEFSVHFPVVGSAFLGSSNTTKIRFYYSKIGDENTTWVSVAKLPNGKQGSKVLDLNEDDYGKYAELELSNWYTQVKGDVFIALQGYQGGVNYEYDDESDLYEIYGTPTIQTTGSIKLAINYAPIGQVADYNDEYSTYQEILAALGEKLNITSGIVAVDKLADIVPSVYENGQMFYDKATRQNYILSSGNLVLMKDYLDFESESTSGTLTSTQLTILNGNDDFIVFNGKAFLKSSGDETRSLYRTAFQPQDNLSGEFDHVVYQEILINKTSGAWTYSATDYPFETHNVVELSQSLGYLTQDEYELLEKTPSFIKFGGRTYYKISETDTNILFTNETLPTITAQGMVVFGPFTITINKSNKMYQYNTTGFGVYASYKADEKFATSLDLTIDSNYDLVVKLLNANGQVIAQDDIDLPLESIVVSATYYDTYTYDGTTYNNVLVIVLATTSVPTIVPLGDLVSGLVSSDDLATALANYYTKAQTDTLLSGKQDTLTFDTTPTTDSSNPVTSGGIKTYVDGLVSPISSALSGKEDVSNKVTTLSGSSTDTQYPSAKVVYDEMQATKEIAQGKTKTYTLAYGDTYSVVATDLQANPTKQIVDENGNDITSAFLTDTDNAYSDYVINAEFNNYTDNYIGTGLTSPTYCYVIVKKIENNQLDLNGDYILCKIDFTNAENTKIRVGDILLVVEDNVADRWFANISDTQLFYKLETFNEGIVYKKNENLIPSANNTYDLGSSSYTFNTAYIGNFNFSQIDNSQWIFKKTDTNSTLLFGGAAITYSNTNLFPNGTKNLGGSSNKWYDIWVNNIKGITTLTQAQYDALVSGGTVDSDTLYFIEE